MKSSCNEFILLRVATVPLSRSKHLVSEQVKEVDPLECSFHNINTDFYCLEATARCQHYPTYSTTKVQRIKVHGIVSSKPRPIVQERLHHVIIIFRTGSFLMQLSSHLQRPLPFQGVTSQFRPPPYWLPMLGQLECAMERCTM